LEHTDPPSNQCNVFSRRGSPTQKHVPRTSPVKKYKTGEHNGEEDEWDGNAWFGCVCGEPHVGEEDVFWLQCECCKSWFNSFRGCADFDGEDTSIIENWVCWGCEEAGSLRANLVADSSKSPTTSEHCPSTNRLRPDGTILPKKTPVLKSDGRYSRPRGSGPKGCGWDPKRGMWVKRDTEHAASLDDDSVSSNSVVSDHREDDDPSNEMQGEDGATLAIGSEALIRGHQSPGVYNPDGLPRVEKAYLDDDSVSSNSVVSDHREDDDPDNEIQGEDGATLGIGSDVMIRGHQSPGVYNPDGVAHVEKAYKNGDGDQVYDVKYSADEHVAKGVLDSYAQQLFKL
jgi:hypothetical protein